MQDISQLMDFFKFQFITSSMKDINNETTILLLLLYGCYYCYTNISKSMFDTMLFRLKHMQFNRKYSIVFSGQKITKHGMWSSRTETLFSDNFRALWNYINEKNINIYENRECHSRQVNYDNEIMNESNTYIVYQTEPFEITDFIYGRVEYNVVENDNQKQESSSVNEIEKIELTIFSYTKNVYEIQDFVKNVRIDYDNEIENSRINKRFIYSLKNVDSKEEQIKWLEKEITTTRNFENMFFPNRKEIMEKIDFFLKNKEWYTHEGHPYSLGIGLHGVPGTGKTSFIKALAKYTNRHLIVIPLNKIKTENDFYDAYFEEQYSTNNVKNIEFKDKIIVFEDIDCMSDIVKKRNVYENDEAKEVHTTYENSEASDIDDNNSTKNESKNDKNISEILINAACSMNNNTNTNRFKKKTEEFTLSFLLNTLDGLLETDGRILIITSNHYRKLDAALTRPGRIDIEIEMKPIEFDTINELYYHYYNENIPRKYQQKMRTIKIAPCDLINIQKTSNMTKTKFINSILQMRQ